MGPMMRVRTNRISFFALLYLVGSGALAAAGDRLVLQSGAVLEGRIVSAGRGRIALALDFGGRMEFDRRDVRAIFRGVSPVRAGAGRPPGGAREEWRYLVYHGERPVGFRRVIRTRDRRDGRAGTLLQEEVVFYADEKGRATGAGRVVTLEFTDDADGFRTLYYRESAAGGAVDSIVDARCRDGRLRYAWLHGGRRTYHTEALAPDVRFPLALWAATGRRGQGPVGVFHDRLWDPRDRRVVETTTRVFPPLDLAAAGQPLRIVPVRFQGARGPQLRWVDARGATVKEYLNGVSLVAVRTTRARFPARSPGAGPPDLRERVLVRTLVEPTSALVARAPGGGWTRAPDGYPGAVLTLVNLEMKSSLAVFWGPPTGAWPGPAPPGPAAVRPAAFGGWPGVGWRRRRGATGREEVVRRRQTGRGRIAVVLDAPEDLMPAALEDLGALLRSLRVPGGVE